MGQENELQWSVSMYCPGCDEEIDVDGIVVIVTVEGHDVGHRVGQGETNVECKSCGPSYQYS